jgi:hypothetical protein
MADRTITRAEHDYGVARDRFRSRITRLALLSVAIDLVAGGLAMWAEHGTQAAFKSYFDALFWTSTQLLTVSSSLPNPAGQAAKVLDVVLELYAIAVVSTLAGTFADLLHHRTRHRSQGLWDASR